MRQLIWTLFLINTLFACKNNSKQADFQTQEMALAAPPPASSPLRETDKVDAVKMPPEVNSTSVIDKKIIKEGSIVFETNNIKATRKIITDSLKRLGGYVGEERESNNSEVNRKEYTLSVRIPAQNFEKFLNTVSTSADRIESKNISSRDVTTE